MKWKISYCTGPVDDPRESEMIIGDAPSAMDALFAFRNCIDVDAFVVAVELDESFTTTPAKIALEHQEDVRDLTAQGIAAVKGKR